jgi:hypothetical protein
VTVAALVTGLIYRARARSKQDSAAAIQARTPTCAGASSVDCAQLATLVDERNRANTNAYVMLGVGGVAAIGTALVTYLVWPARASRESIEASAWVTPDSAGLGLNAQF